MSLRLEQAICLSLAGGFAVIAPPAFPRTREVNKLPVDAEETSEDHAREPRKASRTRSRTARLSRYKSLITSATFRSL